MIMKSGVFDARAGTHKLMDQIHTREDMRHAWYDEPNVTHPFGRMTKPTQKNALDFAGKYSWSTAVSHDVDGRLEAGPLARQLVAGGTHGEAWQHHDPLVLDMYGKLGGASVMLRHFARMHEAVTLYRQAERILRELKLNDPWSSRPRTTGEAGERPRRCAVRYVTGSRSRVGRSRTIRSSRRPRGTSGRGQPMAPVVRWNRR